MIGDNPACESLYPLQPKPGDEPAALTRLTRLVRSASAGLSENEAERALALISEAAEERKALDEAHRASEARWERCNADRIAGLARIEELANQRDAFRHRLSAQQDVINQLSGKVSEALRMGQQQGRVELATELLETMKRGLSMTDLRTG